MSEWIDVETQTPSEGFAWSDPVEIMDDDFVEAVARFDPDSGMWYGVEDWEEYYWEQGEVKYWRPRDNA